MSKALVPVNSKLPAIFQQMPVSAVTSELTGGVTSGFPIISYKGKVWRIRKGGEEELHLDDQGNAKPTVDFVLIQANPMPSKIFYDKAYEEGANETPRCFSNDGAKPDVSVQNPISAICANCPNNVWGSRMTPSGKKSRACSDSRRVAVAFAQDLYENGADAVVYLLRIPPASLNPMKDYAEKVLAPKGIPFFAVATRIAFDPTVAHPQFKFAPARLLNDEEAEAVMALRGSPDVERVLAETQEFPAGAAAPEATAAASSGATGQATPSASSNPAPAAKQNGKLRPASEEEAGIDALDQPAPPPKGQAQTAPAGKPASGKAAAAKAAQTAPAAEADPLAALALAPKKKAAATKPAAPAAETVEEEEQAPAPEVRTATGKVATAATSAPPADFDNLLDSILNG